MKLNPSNIIKLSLVTVCIILGLTLTSCCSSDYIYVKVKKSELMPDACELDRDSLIVGGLKICYVAQRYYYKPLYLGGGNLSFTGFFIPPHLVKTDYGEYSLSSVRNNMIKVSGKGVVTGFDGSNPIEVEFITSKSSTSIAVFN